jgi:hypothetical protein
MKKKYLYLFLTILLSSFDADALNNEDKNVDDNKKITNIDQHISKDKYSFRDTRGVEFIIKKVRVDGKYRFNICQNEEILAAGERDVFGSNNLVYIEIFITRNFEPNTTINFPGGEKKVGSIRSFYFGNDGYVYVDYHALKNKDKEWRLKYR